jgi:hypothetical protein
MQSAQFALAEASSGFFLINEFRELTDFFPVVRKVENQIQEISAGSYLFKSKFCGYRQDEDNGRTKCKKQNVANSEGFIV